MWASSGCWTIGASTPSTSSRTAERSGASRSGCRSSSMVAEGTTLSMALSGEQVANLGEQAHVLRWRGRLGLGVVLAPRQQQVHRLDDEEEDNRRGGEEHDQRVDQVAVGKARAVDREAEVRERVRPEDRPHERRD